MQRSDHHDDPISRLGALDPAAKVPPMTEGALERVTRHAMAPESKSWTWARYRTAMAGTLVGTTAVVAAAILGIESAAPGLPVLAIGSSSAKSEQHPAGAPGSSTDRGVGSMMMPFFTYRFDVAPSLSSEAGQATAYKLSTTEDAQSAAARIARLLGVAGEVTSPYDGAYQVGDDGGPAVSTWSDGNAVYWSYYSGQPGGVTISPDDTSSSDVTTTTQPDATLPTDQQAAADALALLRGAGVDDSLLGTPSVESSSGTEVDVSVPMVVGGFQTDQAFYVAYGHDDAVVSASGMVAGVTAGATYPTISPVDAVGVLSEHGGFLYYGGVMPMAEGVDDTAGPAATGAAGDDPTTGASSGSSDGSGGTGTTPGTVDDTVPDTIQPPVIQVTVDSATMVLTTYTLTDGTIWLLPTWRLSGPEHGESITEPANYQGDVLAVSSQYVDLQYSPIGIK